MSASRSTGGYGDGVVDAKITAPQIPRIVWMLWFDGWKNAPALCLDMLKTWRAYNADWEIRTICSWNGKSSFFLRVINQ